MSTRHRRRMRPLLGTYVEIGVPESPCADDMIDSAFAAIEDVQSKLNRHDPLSELSRLNETRELEMSALSVAVLRLAKKVGRASGGRFSCSGTADVQIHRRRVRLCGDGEISLDGIAKGFAVDLAIKTLKEKGVVEGWVNAGGDLRVFGDLALPLWRREANGQFHLCGHLKNAGAAASSGVRHELDSSFTGNIIDPHNEGSPEKGVWTVLAPSAWLADALTKVACLTSLEERETLIDRLGGHLFQSAGVAV